MSGQPDAARRSSIEHRDGSSTVGCPDDLSRDRTSPRTRSLARTGPVEAALLSSQRGSRGRSVSTVGKRRTPMTWAPSLTPSSLLGSGERPARRRGRLMTGAPKTAQAAKAGRACRQRSRYIDGDLLAASRIARAVRRRRWPAPCWPAGEPEVSFYWIDAATGVTSPSPFARVRMDSSPAGSDCRSRPWVATGAPTHNASSGATGGSTTTTRLQAAHCIGGWEAVTERLPFVHIVVETGDPASSRSGSCTDRHQAGRGCDAALIEPPTAESSGDWPR